MEAPTLFSRMSIDLEDQGLLMSAYDLDPHHAFELLRRLSQQDNDKLRTVAERIVHDHERGRRR